MAARILYAGRDDCHRIGVLECAGYRVKECHSPVELRRELESGASADAVVICEEQSPVASQAVELVRACSSIPLILFGEPQISYGEAPFDLVVPHLSPPDEWLVDVAALIARGQAIRLKPRMESIQIDQRRKKTREMSERSQKRSGEQSLSGPRRGA